MTLFQDGNTVSSNKLILPVALKTIIIKYNKSLLLFLIWTFRTVCDRILSGIIFVWLFRTVCFRCLSVIIFDLNFSHCLWQDSIWYCFWFELFALFVTGFYLLLFFIWTFRTVCDRILSGIVFDLNFSHCLWQDSIWYCFWFELFALFVTGFYLLLFLIWTFRTVCDRILSGIVFDLNFSHCLWQDSIWYCFLFELFALFVTGFYLVLFLIWTFVALCVLFFSYFH
jgi:hypothetical protein